MGIRSISSAVREFLEWCEPRLAWKTVDLHRRYLARFVAFTKNKALRSVRRLDIEKFDHRKHPLESLKRFFSWVCDVAKFRKDNPSRLIPVPEARMRRRVFLRREKVVIRRLAWRSLRDYLLAVEETGGRPKEMREVTFCDLRCVGGRQVDHDSLVSGMCYFELTEFKGRERRKEKDTLRVIPVSPRLGKLIARLLRRVNDWRREVFVRENGRPWTPDALNRRTRRLRKRAGRVLKVNWREIVVYVYRHSVATTLAVNDVSGPLLKEIMGWSTETMARRYVHPNTRQIVDVFRRGMGGNDAAPGIPSPAPGHARHSDPAHKASE